MPPVWSWISRFRGHSSYVRIKRDRVSLSYMDKAGAVLAPELVLEPIVGLGRGKKGREVVAVGATAVAEADSAGLVNEIVRPFDHPRSLLSDWVIGVALARECLQKLIGSQAVYHNLMIVHPMECLEGGLTKVEIRAWEEFAAEVGAVRAAVWVGPELSPRDFADTDRLIARTRAEVS